MRRLAFRRIHRFGNLRSLAIDIAEGPPPLRIAYDDETSSEHCLPKAREWLHREPG
jgi:hypothetical protein